MSQPLIAPNLFWPVDPLEARSFIAGEFSSSTSNALAVNSPYTNTPLGHVFPSSDQDIKRAIEAARTASLEWRRVPIKERVAVLLQLRQLLVRDTDDLARSAALESGKTFNEAKAEVQKGIEVLEFATSLQNSDIGGRLEVSRGVFCEYLREPLGVTLGITPFNFPFMVPMWMAPISLALGNSFILKPSDKVPFTPTLLASLIHEAGFPRGSFSVLHGGRQVVEHLLTVDEIAAVGFVGSTPVAKAVYASATVSGKRALCLGGAKNHLIVVPDAEPALTVDGIVASFTGCAGQRCMAASVLVAVGEVDHIIDRVVEVASKIALGTSMGALIDLAAKTRLVSAIETAVREGASLRLDGRQVQPPSTLEGGHWLGPSVLDNVDPSSYCARTELFGPVLSIVRVKSIEEALELERASQYGNALSIFTSSGHVAQHIAERATSGMIGINVGVPVPREPFSFGGTKLSKFGSGDITGSGGVEHWSNRKKITTKWVAQPDRNWMS